MTKWLTFTSRRCVIIIASCWWPVSTTCQGRWSYYRKSSDACKSTGTVEIVTVRTCWWISIGRCSEDRTSYGCMKKKRKCIIKPDSIGRGEAGLLESFHCRFGSEGPIDSLNSILSPRVTSQSLLLSLTQTPCFDVSKNVTNIEVISILLMSFVFWFDRLFAFFHLLDSVCAFY